VKGKEWQIKMNNDWLVSSERIVNDIAAWTKIHRKATQFGVGTAILLYGHYFPSTILMIASLRVRYCRHFI
jgi:hypothetical protein